MSENANVGRVFNLTGDGGGGGSLKLQSISVRTAPTKTTYKSGETFDPTGMVIEANYGYDVTAVATGYTFSPSVLTDGVSNVTITFTVGRVTKTTTVAVTVQKVLTGISVTTNPTKMSYSYLESFSPTGMVVTAAFSDGTTAPAVGYTYTSSAFTQLGTNPVEISYTYDGVSKTTSLSVNVTAIEVTVPAQSGTLVYSGSSQTPSWNSAYDSLKMTISGVTSAVNAGTYQVTFTLAYGYVFPNTTNSATVNWTIDRATIASIPTQSNTLDADGTQKVPEWNGYDVDKMTMSGDLNGIAAGTYTTNFTPTANYKWWDGSTTAKSATWTITNVLVTIPSQNGTLTYDGTNKIPSWSNFDSENSSVSVIAQANAGTYNATFSLIRGKWSDGTTGDKTIQWTIGKANNTLSLNPTSITLNTSNPTVSIFATRLGNGTISATSSNPSAIAIKSINQTTGEIVVESVINTSGNATITVSVAAGDNYNATSSNTVAVKAKFGYLYGYDLALMDSRPATRVSYPSDVDNYGFAKAVMGDSSFSYGGWPSTVGEEFMPRPCMLKFDGTVDYYLDPDDYTKKADGTVSDVANINYGGNAMMEWPKIYTKRWESNNVYHFRCSNVKVSNDYECWCNYDKNNNEIDHFYTPIYYGSKDSSNRLRSISGQALSNSTSTSDDIGYAKANGANNWFIEVVADHFLEQDLLVMMFKSTDLQTSLGKGIVNASSKVGTTGTMNDKGMFWGKSTSTDGVKAFGMENLWGNTFRRVAGWISKDLAQYVKLTRGTKDGSTATDYNTTGTGYINSGVMFPSSNAYISGMATKPYGRLPNVANGSSTTYEADILQQGIGATNIAFVGGYYRDAAQAGPFFVNVYFDADLFKYGYMGSALSCKPLASA